MIYMILDCLPHSNYTNQCDVCKSIICPIFVSGDGCIFVWRLPAEMTSTMLTRLSQMASNNPNKTRAYITPPDNNHEAACPDGFSPNPTPVDQLMDPAAPHNQTPPAGTAGGKCLASCWLPLEFVRVVVLPS